MTESTAEGSVVRSNNWAFFDALIKYGALFSAFACLVGYCIDEGYISSLGLPRSDIVMNFGALFPKGAIGLLAIFFPTGTFLMLDFYVLDSESSKWKGSRAENVILVLFTMGSCLVMSLLFWLSYGHGYRCVFLGLATYYLNKVFILVLKNVKVLTAPTFKEQFGSVLLTLVLVVSCAVLLGQIGFGMRHERVQVLLAPDAVDAAVEVGMIHTGQTSSASTRLSIPVTLVYTGESAYFFRLPNDVLLQLDKNKVDGIQRSEKLMPI